MNKTQIDTIIPKFVNALAHSVIETIKTISGKKVVCREIRRTKIDPSEENICGSIRISGSLNGKINIVFDEKLANKLAANLALCDEDALGDKDKYEGAGEIINQIVGNTRTKLWKSGNRFEISLPTDEIKNCRHPNSENYDHYIIKFDCAGEKFYLLVDIQSVQSACHQNPDF
jgi:CheY-specific phosphatase CheX